MAYNLLTWVALSPADFHLKCEFIFVVILGEILFINTVLNIYSATFNGRGLYTVLIYIWCFCFSYSSFTAAISTTLHGWAHLHWCFHCWRWLVHGRLLAYHRQSHKNYSSAYRSAAISCNNQQNQQGKQSMHTVCVIKTWRQLKTDSKELAIIQ